jgi:hypothetical protein
VETSINSIFLDYLYLFPFIFLFLFLPDYNINYFYNKLNKFLPRGHENTNRTIYQNFNSIPSYSKKHTDQLQEGNLPGLYQVKFYLLGLGSY